MQATLAGKKTIDEIVTPEEQADAVPYYFALRRFVGQLRKAREAAGLSGAEVARRTGLAAETISRLETGALHQPDLPDAGAVRGRGGGPAGSHGREGRVADIDSRRLGPTYNSTVSPESL